MLLRCLSIPETEEPLAFGKIMRAWIRHPSGNGLGLLDGEELEKRLKEGWKVVEVVD